jgi:hypothetical protein
MGAGLLSRRQKQQGREDDHSRPSSAKVENEWSYTSTPPICLHGGDRDDFTFYLYLGGGECSTLRFVLGDRAPGTRTADGRLSPVVGMAAL